VWSVNTTQYNPHLLEFHQFDFICMLCYVHVGTIKCVCINVCVWMNNVDMSFQLDDTTANRTEKTLPVDGSIVFPKS
jgi:hypothetical protein